MANKKLKNKKRFETQVYDRKILRNILKSALKTNKIKKAWKEFKKKK